MACMHVQYQTDSLYDQPSTHTLVDLDPVTNVAKSTQTWNYRNGRQKLNAGKIQRFQVVMSAGNIKI
jgi:hypothetical protein